MVKLPLSALLAYERIIRLLLPVVVNGSFYLLFICAAGRPVLQPFPSCQWQNMSDPNAFQYVQSMEVRRYDIPFLFFFLSWAGTSVCVSRHFDSHVDSLPVLT
jgi:hypothetical protein